jgi:hypothetical protein
MKKHKLYRSHDGRVEDSAESKESTRDKLSDSLCDIVQWSAMSKSKMIRGRPPFRITTNLLSSRVKGGDWNACFGAHGRHRIIGIGDCDINVQDRLPALRVILNDAVMDVRHNTNESIPGK